MAKTGTTVAELPTGQARPPSRIYRAFQWKYNIDKSCPWWRKLYFHFIWLPFARFSYLRVGIVPFDRLEPDGSLSWKEDQGYFTSEWQAAQEAAKYPFGGYNEVAMNAAENAESCKPRVQFPNSAAKRAYLKRGRRQVELDVGPLERLQQVLNETQAVVDSQRTR